MIAVAPESYDVMTYDEAVLYCQFCNYDGHTNWRIPTYNEYLATPQIFGWYKEDEDDGDIWTVCPVRDV
jgi:hypothetical protein